jgi:hypothetical protein
MAAELDGSVDRCDRGGIRGSPAFAVATLRLPGSRPFRQRIGYPNDFAIA